VFISEPQNHSGKRIEERGQWKGRKETNLKLKIYNLQFTIRIISLITCYSLLIPHFILLALIINKYK